MTHQQTASVLENEPDDEKVAPPAESPLETPDSRRMRLSRAMTGGLSSVKFPSPNKVKKRSVPVKRVMEITLVEVAQISNLAVVQQRFGAQFYIELKIAGGALDEDLMKPGAAFPFGDDGRPTFLPPAGWYLKQFDFNNAISFNTMDSRVRIDGDDLFLSLRYEGTFMEALELQDFPFDAQDLQMSLAINCRTTGMTPVDFVVSPNCKSSFTIAMEHFTLGSEWELHDHIRLETGTSGTDADRLFPCVNITSVLVRKPHFYLINIAVPMALFGLMGNFQFTLPRHDTADRFNMCFALLLTVVAFKFSINAMIPPVSYLTNIDRFILASSGLIVLCCFEAGVQGAILKLGVDSIFDARDAEEEEALRRQLKGTKDSAGGATLAEDEVLWQMSRSGIMRTLDLVFVVINLSLFALCAYVACQRMRSSGLSAKREREKAEKEKNGRRRGSMTIEASTSFKSLLPML